MVYKWREGRGFGVSAQVAGDVLEQIRTDAGGDLLPRDVVEASRPQDAPLHGCFEWNRDKAAARWREHQARHIIGSVVEVVIRAEGQAPVQVSAFVHVRPPESGSCYRTSASVMSDRELRQQVLDEALTYLRGFQRRYAELEVFAGICDEIERAAEAVAARNRKKAARKRAPKRDQARP